MIAHNTIIVYCTEFLGCRKSFTTSIKQVRFFLFCLAVEAHLYYIYLCGCKLWLSSRCRVLERQSIILASQSKHETSNHTGCGHTIRRAGGRGKFEIIKYTIHTIRRWVDARRRRRRRHNDHRRLKPLPPQRRRPSSPSLVVTTPPADPSTTTVRCAARGTVAVRRAGGGKYWSGRTGPPAARSFAGRRQQTLYRSRGNSTGVPSRGFFPCFRFPSVCPLPPYGYHLSLSSFGGARAL